jgi:tetratricopeptide (TPR) repeat protein
VLAHNPYHIDALINVVGAYASMGKVSEAIRAVLRAIEIDRNYRTSYFQLSKIFLAENNHENAIQALQLTLDRWAYDSEVLNEMIDICLDYDLMDQAVAKISFIHDFMGWSVEEYLFHNPELKEKIIAAQFRISDYNRLLGEAQQYHLEKQYREAEGILAQAMEVSKNNMVAEFNFYLCQFHLGERAILVPLVRLYSRTNDPIRKLYCLLLGLLIAVDTEQYPYLFALGMVETMVSMLNEGPMNRYDLPRIPLHYYEAYSMEEKDFEPILSRLRTLKENVGNQENIDFLYHNYLQLSKEWA